MVETSTAVESLTLVIRVVELVAVVAIVVDSAADKALVDMIVRLLIG